MQGGPQPIPVYRPTEITDGPEFQPFLVESPANIFYQQVQASRATLDRMQFQWRSVSDNLLLSPTMRLRFKLRISCPLLWTQIMAAIPIAGVYGFANAGNNSNATTFADGEHDQTASYPNPPFLVYADGDAFTNCCSSINLNFNGTSLSLNRTNMFWRDYQRTQISSEDSARIYKSSGGPYDKYDQTAVSVALNTSGVISAGATMDSGIIERSKALYASLQTGDAKTGDATFIPYRDVWVSYPVPVAPFNPWRGHAMPSTSPYSACPLAIPHLSAGGIDFLLENFRAAFIRRLGSGGTAADGKVLNGSSSKDVGIELVDKSCVLELKYFRLSHTRTLKESYRFNVWQAQTFLHQKGSPEHVTMGTDTNKLEHVLPPIGRDPVSAQVLRTTASMVSYVSTDRVWEVKFDTINLAQVPSFLLISAPKLSDQYSLAGDNACLSNCVRNLSRNLCIKNMKIVVNSARGAIDVDGTDQSGYVDAERLWEMTLENAGSHYFKEGGFRAWRDYGCAVLLNSAQFAPGLQVCDGVAYPIQIQLSMELENRAVDVMPYQLHGIKSADVVGAGPQGSFQRGKLAPQVAADFIRAQAQCTAIFTKIVLTTTETSATTNALNYPLDSAERLLNAAGQMR